MIQYFGFMVAPEFKLTTVFCLPTHTFKKPETASSIQWINRLLRTG
jgi:hypothetical protein